MAAMSAKASASVKQVRGDESDIGEFEAWQYMNARFRFAQYNADNGKIDESVADEALVELKRFVDKHGLYEKEKRWKIAQRSLLGL